MKTGDIVTFAPRDGETAEGIVTRVWDKPAGDPYVTVRTTEDAGRTFVRCSSSVSLAAIRVTPSPEMRAAVLLELARDGERWYADQVAYRVLGTGA